ncbi:capsular biosynthesis protein [uncultured Amphritea sp.]|uniref:capsule biosynthesis protein n=1 Tax=uncultured Amphritea sp. TaxID=981605 RepID=UPI0026321382|nr:capsular biosynthesis protein [uncultured Amphritea sp.]
MTLRNCEKVFLLLQGPPSRFSSLLFKELKSRQVKCFKIHLSLGDWLFWQGGSADNYRGKLSDWPAYLKDYIQKNGVTDVVYYADRTPYHKAAIKIAAELGINAITYENGYLRPFWITLEHGGMSRLSHFPNDPQDILRKGQNLPLPVTHKNLGHPFWLEAWNEVVFSLANYFDIAFFRHYQSDKVYNPIYEYLNYIPRLLRDKKNQKKAEAITSRLKAEKQRFFLFPLQMQNDYQLRENSPFDHQSEAIELAIQSLKLSGQQDTSLLFKIHPMDNGIEPWEKIISELTARHNLEGRILVIDGGNLNKIMNFCTGIITINSTVGVHGLQKIKPIVTLGDAMYDIPGLTSQQPLTAFFQQPEPPIAELVDAFVRLIAATIQIHGSFISAKGRELAVHEMCDRLITNSVNQPGAFLPTPPRIRKTVSMSKGEQLHI